MIVTRKRGLLLAILFFFSVVGAVPSRAQGWSNSYAYRRTITIDHTLVPNTDQTNFPVLISGAFPDLSMTANGGNVTNATGYDIIFTSDANGMNTLPFEQEAY